MNTDPVRHRLGRRGASLLTWGILWIAQAFLVWRSPHTAIPHEWFLSHFWQGWVVALFIAGGISIACAPRRQGRDWPGWVATYLVAFLIAIGILDAVVETAFTGSDVTDIILASVSNYAILAQVIIIAGVREPIDMPSFKKGSDQ